MRSYANMQSPEFLLKNGCPQIVFLTFPFIICLPNLKAPKIKWSLTLTIFPGSLSQIGSPKSDQRHFFTMAFLCRWPIRVIPPAYQVLLVLAYSVRSLCPPPNWQGFHILTLSGFHFYKITVTSSLFFTFYLTLKSTNTRKLFHIQALFFKKYVIIN